MSSEQVKEESSRQSKERRMPGSASSIPDSQQVDSASCAGVPSSPGWLAGAGRGTVAAMAMGYLHCTGVEMGLGT